MYPGYLINNILESINPLDKINSIYSPHYSIFDTILTECNIELYTFHEQSRKVFNFEKIHKVEQSRIYKIPYSLFLSNHAIKYINENHSYALHVNAIIFCHDYDSYAVKPEEKILACQKGFRNSDTVLCFNDSITQGLKCQKNNIQKMIYAIPKEFTIDNKEERNTVGIFCYNKSLSPELVNEIHPNAKTVSVFPENLAELNKELNQYKIVVELDPSSIINVLAAIACGCIGIINDPNNWLKDYQNIPNLYILKSVGEIQQLLSTTLAYKEEPLPAEYRKFDEFKQKINNIVNENRKKAFVL